MILFAILYAPALIFISIGVGAYLLVNDEPQA